MKFSIITPTYNRASTLERAIRSILNQSYQNFEMIIVDDGSTDSTIDILKKYSNDSRIKVFILPINGGVNVARNTGLKNVSDDSNWITFLDSDDEFVFDALLNMKFAIEANKTINYFRFPVKYTDGTFVSDINLFNTVDDYKGYVSHIDTCGEWVVTFSKKVLKNGFLYDERVKAFESLSWLKLVMTEDIFYSDFVVRLYYVDTVSISRPSKKTLQYYENLITGFSLILNEHEEFLKKYNPKFFISYVFELANVYAIVGDKKTGFKKLIYAMKYDFFNFGVFRFLKNSIVKRV